MATDTAVWELRYQLQQQFHDGTPLGRRTSIVRITISIQTSLVTDTDGVFVITGYMGRDKLKRAHRYDLTALTDVIVIPCGIKSTGLVVTLQLFRCVILIYTGRRAVDHDQIYFTIYLSHFLNHSTCDKNPT